MNITEQQLLNFKKYLENKYPIFLLFELDYNVQNEQYIILGLFEIIDNNRNKGYGTKVMYEIINFSNAHKISIALTPTDFFNCNINRLINFYKRFGFILNDNKKIFYEKMYYIPK